MIAKIYVANNYIRITNYEESFRFNYLIKFINRNCVEYKLEIDETGNSKWVKDHIYARQSNDKKEIRMSSELLNDLLTYLEFMKIDTKQIDIVKEDEIISEPVEFKWKPGMGGYLNDLQKEWCEYQLSDGHIKVNNNLMGQGKTYMAIKSMADINERTLVTCLPKYIPVWLTGLNKFLELEPDDIYYCDEKLETTYEKIINKEINPKIFLLPLTRIEVFLRDERVKELPNIDDIYKAMKIGLRIMDESHESIFRVYMSLLSCNVKKTIGLSATLKSDQEFINKVYEWVFPPKCRYKEPNKTKHVNCVALHYRMDVKKLNLKWFRRGSYSHDVFETGVMKTEKGRNFYYKLVKKAIDDYFIDYYEPGQKVAIFFYRVDTCGYFANRLKEDYPNLDVGKYTGEESKSKDPDVRNSFKTKEMFTTTLGSCGTGKDIPNLACVICTPSVSSRQSNLQVFGRTRPLVNYKDKTPYFVYFVCDDIPEQKRHSDKRKQLFKPLSISLIDGLSGMSFV